MRTLSNRIPRTPGAAPGIEHDEIASLPGGSGQAHITCLDYSPAHVSFLEVDSLKDFVAVHRPEWSTVRWINMDGLSDMNAIHALATKYDLHPLAIEDLLHGIQRPKIESYGGEESDFQARLFLVARLPRIEKDRLHHAQVSIFLSR